MRLVCLSTANALWRRGPKSAAAASRAADFSSPPALDTHNKTKAAHCQSGRCPVWCVRARSRMQEQSGAGAWAAQLRGALRLGADAERVRTEQLLALATQVYGDDPQAQVRHTLLSTSLLLE